MNQFDKNVPAASAGKEDREESLWRMVGESFRGRMGWMCVVACVYMLALAVLAVFSAIWFFRVEATRDLILYAALFVLAIFLYLAVKLWYWMLLNRNSVLRQIRRLEGQIAELTGRKAE